MEGRRKGKGTREERGAGEDEEKEAGSLEDKGSLRVWGPLTHSLSRQWAAVSTHSGDIRSSSAEVLLDLEGKSARILVKSDDLILQKPKSGAHSAWRSLMFPGDEVAARTAAVLSFLQ